MAAGWMTYGHLQADHTCRLTTCGSIIDIQSTTAESKQERKKKKKIVTTAQSCKI